MAPPFLSHLRRRTGSHPPTSLGPLPQHLALAQVTNPETCTLNESQSLKFTARSLQSPPTHKGHSGKAAKLLSSCSSHRACGQQCQNMEATVSSLLGTGREGRVTTSKCLEGLSGRARCLLNFSPWTPRPKDGAPLTPTAPDLSVLCSLEETL